MKVKHVIEGQNLVEIREWENGRIEKEILAIGNPERWAQEYGIDIESPKEKTVTKEKQTKPKRRGRKPKKKSD